MNGVMRFDVPYVLPQLLDPFWYGKIMGEPFGGINGTQGFDMAVEKHQLSQDLNY